MRIIHTADWHVGRIFFGTHLTNEQAHVLGQLVELIKEAKADVLVIAGDVYDRSVPPTEAVQLLDDILAQILLDCQIPVVMIAGNHDSPERLGFGNRLLSRQGLHVFGMPGKQLRPVVLPDKTGPVYFLPLPYAEPVLIREKFQDGNVLDHHDAVQCMADHLLAQVPAGMRTVGIAHSFVAGGAGSESERPLTVGGSGQIAPGIFKPFNYTALGHLHNAQTAGNEHIRYAGSLMKYSFDEADHHKGVNIIDMDACGRVSIEQVPLTPRRDVRRIRGLLADLLTGRQSGVAKEDYLMVTLEDREPILDVIGKLRQVYPNVLQVERPYLSYAGDLCKPEFDYRRQSEAQIFAAFFKQVTGELLSGEQELRLAELLDEMFRQKREAAG